MKRSKNATHGGASAAIALYVVWNICCGFVLVVEGDEPARTIVRVEEDWELVVAAPDANSISPQITCAISPTHDNYSTHATFQLNHQSQPDFAAGGLALQTWSHEIPVTTHKFPRNEVMTTPNETVRWTQTMTLSDGELKFQIVDGRSATWDSFGDQGHLSTVVTTDLTNLNGYTPTLSVKNSGVGYAANRVTSLVLKRVRAITASGDVLQDSTERVVHKHR